MCREEETKNRDKKKLEATLVSEEQPTSRSTSDLSSQVMKPKGRPPKCKKNEISNLSSQSKRPRDRLEKKQESNNNGSYNYQLVPTLSIEYLVGLSNCLRLMVSQKKL